MDNSSILGPILELQGLSGQQKSEPRELYHLANLKMTTSEFGNSLCHCKQTWPSKKQLLLEFMEKISWEGKCEPCAYALPSGLPHLRNGLLFERVGVRSLHAGPECFVPWECAGGHFSRQGAQVQISFQSGGCFLVQVLPIGKKWILKPQYLSAVIPVDQKSSPISHSLNR